MSFESPLRPGNAGLLDLPNEIISAICSSLCLHCQIDRVVEATPAVVIAAYGDQQALSRLSQCSKRLRDLAQPVLFHWYHVLEEEEHDPEIQRLASFVNALIKSPNLCASVKALSFPGPEFQLGGRAAEVRTRLIADRHGIYDRAIQAIGGHLSRRSLYYFWIGHLRELTIAITPGLSQLCFHRTSPEEHKEKEWVRWGNDMNNLTYLAFSGARRGDPRAECTYHINEAKDLLRHTPNLLALVAADCSGGRDKDGPRQVSNEAWDVPFPKLRKLSLNGISVPELLSILECCPALEDLEYFDETPFPIMVLYPQHHLGHLTKTLRRLCYSMIAVKPRAPTFRSGSWAGDSYADDPEGDDEDVADMQSILVWGCIDLSGIVVEGKEDDVGMSFSSFPVLEEVEVEQLLLCGPVFVALPEADQDRAFRLTTPEGFLARMPPMLRRLRIGCIIHWPMIFRDLLALAEQSSRFPSLESVIIEVFKPPPQDEHRHLAETFRVVNVEFSVRRVVRSSRSRGLLPARPGHPEIVPEALSYS